MLLASFALMALRCVGLCSNAAGHVSLNVVRLAQTFELSTPGTVSFML